MVNYPNISSLDGTSGIAGIMALPNSSYPYFWGWILGGLWLIITLTLYFVEKEKLSKVRILSCMSVASLAIIFLAVIGTVMTIITVQIMVYILVLSMIIIAVWFFSGK